MVRLECPECRAIQMLDDSWRGLVAQCTCCGKDLPVPEATRRAVIGPDSPLDDPDEQVPVERQPAASTSTSRRRGKLRRRRPARRRQGTLHFLLGVIDAFGWALLGLFALGVILVILAVYTPTAERLLAVLGSSLVIVGNIWIGFVAYQENGVYGMLCFCTCLFTYVYIVMNPEETWRPGALTVLGFVYLLAWFVLSHLSGVPAPG